MIPPSISTYVHSVKALQEKAEELSREFGIPLIENPTVMTQGLVLSLEEQGLVLRELPYDRGRSYLHGFSDRYVSEGKDPLLRAMGGQNQLIWDLTAGWCVDAWHLCNNGHSVQALEQNPVVFAMTRDALERSADSVIKNQLSVSFGEAKDWLGNPPQARPQVIYLDPMYPQKQKKSAAVAKPLQFLKLMCEETEDDTLQSLVLDSLKIATRRVVVKRPIKAAAVANKKLSGSTRGKLVRFDIYSAHS